MTRKNLVLWIVVCSLDGISILIGSVIGSRAGGVGLFVGAMVGGILGVAGATGLGARFGLIEKTSYVATLVGGLIGFAIAAVIAINNLNGLVIPLASAALIGLGAVLGNTWGNKIWLTTKLTVIALMLLVPAVLLEVAGTSKFYWSPNNPIYQAFDAVFSDPRNGALNIVVQGIVMFGPALAVVLCALPILRINIRREADTLVSTIAVKGNVVNLAIIVVGLAAMAVVALYIIGENAPCLLGYQLSC